MRSGLIGFALATSIGIFHHAQPVYIPTSCMDHIKFTKPVRKYRVHSVSQITWKSHSIVWA
jgi:hypothetical protein